MAIKIHPTAEVQSKAIGDNTHIWQYCVILENAKIGKNCNINLYVFVESDVVVGDNVTVKPGVQLWNGIRIGNNVFIGPNVTFTNDLFPRSKHFPKTFVKTYIEEGASVGANATILAGITIGAFAMVGAGSVVTKNIPPFTVWYGNPARHKGYITRDGKIVSLQLFDNEGNNYELKNGEPLKK